MSRSYVGIGAQLGVETTKGTATAANKKLLGLTITPSPETETSQFRPNGFTVPTVSQLVTEATTADIEGPIDFRTLPYLYSSMFGAVTPTEVDEDAAYEWQWDFVGKGELNPLSYTVEVGAAGSGNASRFTHGVVDSLSFDISKNGENTFSGSMVGQQFTTATTLTASPTEIDIMPVNGVMWDAYVDSTSIGLGTTKLQELYSASLGFDGLFERAYTIDSTKPSFSSLITAAEPDLSWTATVGVDSTLNGYLTAARSGGKRFVRLKAVGATIPDSTETFSLQIDMCVVVTGFGSLGESDGLYAADVDFALAYDPTWGKAMQITVVNDIAAL